MGYRRKKDRERGGGDKIGRKLEGNSGSGYDSIAVYVCVCVCEIPPNQKNLKIKVKVIKLITGLGYSKPAIASELFKNPGR